jgi:hypothetical protein
LTSRLGLVTGLREQALMYIKEKALCSDGHGCDCEKLHLVNCRSGTTIIAIGRTRGNFCRRIEIQSRITDEDKEIILSALFNDPHLFGYLRNTWSLRSLSRCLTDELDIPISFKHLQRLTKDLGWM